MEDEVDIAPMENLLNFGAKNTGSGGICPTDAQGWQSHRGHPSDRVTNRGDKPKDRRHSDSTGSYK